MKENKFLVGMNDTNHFTPFPMNFNHRSNNLELRIKPSVLLEDSTPAKPRVGKMFSRRLPWRFIGVQNVTMLL